MAGKIWLCERPRWRFQLLWGGVFGSEGGGDFVDSGAGSGAGGGKNLVPGGGDRLSIWGSFGKKFARAMHECIAISGRIRGQGGLWPPCEERVLVKKPEVERLGWRCIFAEVQKIFGGRCPF